LLKIRSTGVLAKITVAECHGVRTGNSVNCQAFVETFTEKAGSTKVNIGIFSGQIHSWSFRADYLPAGSCSSDKIAPRALRAQRWLNIMIEYLLAYAYVRICRLPDILFQLMKFSDYFLSELVKTIYT